MYLTNACRRACDLEMMVDHVTGYYAHARQQLTPGDLADIEVLLQVTEHITSKLAVFSQQVLGDLIAARRAVA
jgi:hypothetical protein